ncbi:hypothetical protein GCM10022255_091410 [Dactylosporangium darangshiense]|uniref:Uncharacterized protein n=1 Tax=Dactylosporangium darangshiense TaxID=579108 RepID=A0ABP8DP51_9ACTN
MEGRNAHPSLPGDLLDEEALHVVVADPAHRPGDVAEAAVGQPELANRRALLAGHEPPEDLAFDQWREYRDVARPVEQAHEADDGVQQLGGRGAHDEAGRHVVADIRQIAGCRLQEHVGDGGRIEVQADPEAGELRAGLDEMAAHGQVDGGDEVLPGPVAVDAIAQRQPLGALCHHREDPAVDGRRRRVRPVGPEDQHVVDPGLQVGARVAGQQAAELVEGHT